MTLTFDIEGQGNNIIHVDIVGVHSKETNI